MTFLSFPYGWPWGISRDAPTLPPSLYGRSLARSVVRWRHDQIFPAWWVTHFSYAWFFLFINFYWFEVTYIFPQTNIIHINRQTRYIIYLQTHPTIPLNPLLLLNRMTSTAQQQHEILYTSSCFYTWPISYCELLVYYLILRSLSQAGESL